MIGYGGLTPDVQCSVLHYQMYFGIISLLKIGKVYSRLAMSISRNHQQRTSEFECAFLMTFTFRLILIKKFHQKFNSISADKISPFLWYV